MEYDIEEILYTFEDDYNPSSKVPGPRNMYNQGQLVQPNADGSRPGYNGRKNKKISYDKENKIIKEYNTYLSDEIKSGNMSKSLGFKSWLRENKTPAVFEKTYNAWSKKLLNVKPASVTDAKVGLLKTFVERANKQGQFVEKKKLLELIGRTQTPGVAEKNVYIENILKEINKLESREDKVYKAFNRLFNNELVFVTDPEFYKKFPSDKEAGSITRMLIQETGLTGPTIRKHRATWKKDGSKVPFFNTKKGKEQLSIIEHMNLKMGKVGEATFDGFNFNDLMEYGSNSKKGKMFYKSATGSDFYKDPNNVVRDFVVRHFDHNSKFGDKSKLIKVFKKGTNTEVKYEAGKRLIDFDFTYKGKRYGSNELAKEYLKWTRGENTPFSEVYNNHKSYTSFLKKPVNIGDPNIKNIGDLFKLAGHRGMAIEHGSLGGVAEEPFKNLKLLSSRANSELGTILQYYKKFPEVQKLLVNEFIKELPVNENYIDALAKNEIKIAKDMLKNGNTTIPMTYNQAAKNILTNRNIKNFSPEELLTVSKSAFGKDIGYKSFVGVAPESFENIKTQNQLKKIIASLGGGTCSVFSGKKAKLKADGGRIGLSTGTPDVDECYDAAVKIINSNKVPVDRADDFAKLLKRASSIGRGIMKYGIIPEALYATADSFVRMGMGDTFKEAGLRATDYILPGDQTKAAEISKVSRIFGDETGELVARTIDYKNQLAKIKSLEDQKANFENLSGGGEFDYIGDLSGDVKNTDKQLIQAKNDLDNKFKISEAEQLFAESKQDDAYDASKANSFFTKLKAKYRDSSDNLSDVETLAAPEKTQMQLNLNMFPTAPREYMMATDDEIRRFVEQENAAGENLNAEKYINFRDQLKDDFMIKGPDVYGKEQVYGTQGTFGGEPVDMTNYQPNSNRFGSQQRPVLYPKGRGTLAGGGIAKEAGDSSGPPPVSGPQPQGLSYLFNRVKKI